MSGLLVAMAVGIALVVGLMVGWAVTSRSSAAKLREQASRLELERSGVERQLAKAQGEIALLSTDREHLSKKQEAAKTLDERLEPVRRALETLQKQTHESDKERAKADTEIRQQIRYVQENYTSLESATRQLVLAMTSSQSRGQWGEVQLERILEYAGLIEGVHFRSQETRVNDTKSERPDIIIDLPGGGEILIDAKFPFDSYWKAVQAEEAGQGGVEDLYRKHAGDVLLHVRSLASKKYSAGSQSADFVVMFMPFESLLSSALGADGELLHQAFSRNVTLATPTSLLPMLRTIAFGYDRRLMADNAEEIRREGAEMLSRLETALGYVADLRKGLLATVKGYNAFVGSVDSRLVAQARKLQEMGVPTDRAVEAPREIQESLRELRSLPKDDAESDVREGESPPELGSNEGAHRGQ